MIAFACCVRCVSDDKPCVVLVDEVQVLYDTTYSSDLHFWGVMKALAIGTTNVRVVLAAAYGSSGGLEYASIPIDVKDRMVVSIFPPAPGHVSLQLTSGERCGLWQNFVNYSGLALNEALSDYLFKICAGQVRALMIMICIVYCFVCMCASSSLLLSLHDIVCAYAGWTVLILS
jgi:hypothetical protein